MSDDVETLAELTRAGGYVEARTMRQLAHPTPAVWRMLTEPAMLAQWLAPGRIEPKLGGAVRLDFEGSGTVIDSAVTAFEDGRLLEYSWSREGEPARPLRWQMETADGGTRLGLTHRTPEAEDPGRACAGWEAHLAMLEAALAGAPIKFPFERFRAARDAYRPKVAALAG